MKVKLVCPRCSYGFEAVEATEYQCPNPSCAHEWRVSSKTLIAALTIEGRRARPELVVRSGEREGLVFPLEKPQTILGRSTDCDIAFSNLGISRKHAAVRRAGDDCILVDLGSRAGTFVNRQRVTEARLQMGDEIVLSGVLLEFRVRYESAADAESLASARLSGDSEGTSRLPSVRFRGELVERVPLEGDRLVLGRQGDLDVTLEHPLISRRHAMLVRDGDTWSVVDAKSRNGTFVNGRATIQQNLDRGDRVQFGPMRFVFDGDGLVLDAGENNLRLETFGLGVTTERGQDILQGVDLCIEPGKLVGIIGPSGSGKTTLLNALSGFRRATAGQVRIAGRDLYAEYHTFKTAMGYVPQDDIIHTELTAEQALTYAARLRLPRDTKQEEIDRLVGETLDTLGLSDRRDLVIRRLSGGQRKRVSLGVELLTRADLIFMDEPTSGLDPGTEGRMMRLFRKLVDQGRSVVLTTHVMENVDILDKVAVLHDGRLVYFGHPADMMDHFGIERATHLYDKLAEWPAEKWEALRELEGELQREDDAPQPAPPSAAEALPHVHRAHPFLQVSVLSRRYARILLSDWRSMALMVLQPLIIFPAVCGTITETRPVMFVAALAMFWLGITNSARELVRERPIYLRERMVGVSVPPYILSKLLVLSVASVAQTAFALLIVHVFRDTPGNPLGYAALYLAAAWGGMATGLLVSAVATSSEQATAVLPMVVVPQIVLGGFVEPLGRMNDVAYALSHAISTRWSYDSAVRLYVPGSGEHPLALDQPISAEFWVDTSMVLAFAVVAAVATVLWLSFRDRRS